MLFALSLFSFTLLHGMRQHGMRQHGMRPPSPTATARNVQALPAAIQDIFRQNYGEQEKLARFAASYPQNIEVVLMAPTRPHTLLSMLIARQAGGSCPGAPARLSDIMKRDALSDPPKVGDVLVWKGGNEFDWTRGTVAEGPDGSLVIKDVRINFCPITADMAVPASHQVPEDVRPDVPRVGEQLANIEFNCAYDRARRAMITEDRACLPSSGMHGADRAQTAWETLASYATTTDEGYAQMGMVHGFGQRTAELTITSLPDDVAEDAEEPDTNDLQLKFALIMGAVKYWLGEESGVEWMHEQGGYSIPNDIPQIADKIAETEFEFTDEAIAEILQETSNALRPRGIYVDTLDLEQVRQAIKPDVVRATIYAIEHMPHTMEGHCSSNGRQGASKIVMNRGGEVITPGFLLDRQDALADLGDALAGATRSRSPGHVGDRQDALTVLDLALAGDTSPRSEQGFARTEEDALVGATRSRSPRSEQGSTHTNELRRLSCELL